MSKLPISKFFDKTSLAASILKIFSRWPSNVSLIRSFHSRSSITCSTTLRGTGPIHLRTLKNEVRRMMSVDTFAKVHCSLESKFKMLNLTYRAITSFSLCSFLCYGELDWRLSLPCVFHSRICWFVFFVWCRLSGLYCPVFKEWEVQWGLWIPLSAELNKFPADPGAIKRFFANCRYMCTAMLLDRKTNVRPWML